ncbi:hypothetical protein [Faecalispora anaeroviscerum]|uniref:hypothetical protein n=1 Tax=Faecalispora anaeroviscerum TaxID=2991836 RepID=UPI0024BB61EA|nr:hypothetical protein [Faecalispora anaeroviscerum]
MIKIKNGGIVREVETQREADYYADFGYEVISTDQEEKTVPEDGDTEKVPEDGDENNSDKDKKPDGSGKKGAPKEG